MHGLIFKIKESHRQDQSESFVIYLEIVYILTNNIHIHLFFIQQSQMKSLHYDQCLFHYHYHTYECIYVMINCVYVVSSRRNKTNPHHGINTFLFLYQLVYKHSSPNKHQLINHNESINKMLSKLFVHKLKHFQPHSLRCQL